jgi:hypothetical protein
MNRKFFPAIIGGAFVLALSIGVASAEPATLSAVQMDGVTGAGYDRNEGKQYCKKDTHKGNYNKVNNYKGCSSCAPTTHANLGYSVGLRLGVASAGNIDP